MCLSMAYDDKQSCNKDCKDLGVSNLSMTCNYP